MTSTVRRRIGVTATALALVAAGLTSGGMEAFAASPAGQTQPADSSAPGCVRPETPQSTGYDTATKRDAAFNRDFRHCFLTVDGVQMHYVIGGTGSQTMVLLHGWPESWYEFNSVMPQILPGRTVIAVDLPGLGDSTGTPSNFATSTLATYVHDLLTALGRNRNVQVVGHDFGAGVAYCLAATYRSEVGGLLMMDFPLVGKTLKYADFSGVSFHFEFNRQSPLAEQLVTGRERQYLSYFFPLFSHSPGAIPAKASVDEYTRVYSRSQVLHAGFELYRNWSQNESDNTKLEQTPLTIPVRFLTEQGFFGLLSGPVLDAAPNAVETEVSTSGHWLPEEVPSRVVTEINALAPAS